MNNITPIISTNTVVTNNTANKTSFRATNSIPMQESYDSFIKEQEEAKKKAKKQQRLNTFVQVGVLTALAASVGLTAWMLFGKRPPKTHFAKLAESLPSLSDDCVNPKAKEFIENTIKLLKAPRDYINHTAAKVPRMVLFHGPTGTGKTFSAKLLAKEMGANYAEIQFSDLSSEYVGKTAVNISHKFKEIAKMAKKNPKEQFVVAFNEIDSLINNVAKLGANDKHLAQNRTSFLNGLDFIKDIPNLTIVGTTNINPKTANLDAATLSRLGNIFEIEKPTPKEIKSAIKFHLQKSKAAAELLTKDTELENIANLIAKKHGAQRDVSNIVDTALVDFTVKNLEKANNTSIPLTANYLVDAINKKEVWAAGLETGTAANGASEIPNKVMDAIWNFIAQYTTK